MLAAKGAEVAVGQALPRLLVFWFLHPSMEAPDILFSPDFRGALVDTEEYSVTATSGCFTGGRVVAGLVGIGAPQISAGGSLLPSSGMSLIVPWGSFL
jgi:hypothetical protein